MPKVSLGHEGWMKSRDLNPIHTHEFDVVKTAGRPRGTFLQGPSTRNQRIERLWVDLQMSATNRYRELFYQLEDDGHLDSSNAVDIYCLHFVFLPMLNGALRTFTDTWNTHGIRTANYGSPDQMWWRSMLRMVRNGADNGRPREGHSTRCKPYARR